MADNENNGQEGAVKAPLVKRLKMPTVQTTAPAKTPAPQTPTVHTPPVSIPAEPPLDDDEDESLPGAKRPAPRPTPTPAPTPTSAPAQTSSTASATTPEAKEPDLPLEKKSQVATSPIEAEEMEKGAVRKRKRSSGRKTQAELHEEAQEKKRQAAKENAEKKLKEAKEQASKLLENKFVKLGLAAVVGLCFLCGVYSYLPVLAEKKLPELFAANGIPFKRFTMKSFTMEEMEMSNISDASGTMTVSSMKFKYEFLGLLTKGEILSMEASGVKINGVKRNDGVSLGALGDLISSPVAKQRANPLIIQDLKITGGSFTLTDEENKEKEPIVVGFSSKGSWKESGLSLNVSTNYKSPTMEVEAETLLEKTALSSQIKTNITKGDLLKESQNIGSVTGALDVSVDSGVLTKGDANLLLSSSSQQLKLKASVIPQNTGFDVVLDLERSFENAQESVGKFVGDISLIAKNMTVSGNTKAFSGNLPVNFVSKSLTNGSVVVNDLKTDLNINFNCQGSDCRASLTKPMTFGFNNLLYTGPMKQFKFFKPLDITIHPDPQEPFLISDATTLQFALPIVGFSTQLFVSDSRSNLQVVTAMNNLKVNFKYAVFSGDFMARSSFAQSGFATKDAQLAGVSGMATFGSDSLPSANVRIAKVSLAQKDILPDFAADVNIKPMGLDEFSLTTNVNIQGGLVTSNISGSYNLRQKEWRLFVVVPKVFLSDNELNIETTLPFLKSYIPPSTRGALAAKGRVTIKPDGTITGPLKVLMENIQIVDNKVSIKGLNGVVELSSLKPFETASNQQLFIGELNIGIPFRNVLVHYRVMPYSGFEVASMRMAYADGQFKTIKPFVIPFEGDSDTILFEGSGISLSSLTTQLKSTAFRADGEIDSLWRLAIKDKKLMVEEALFESKLAGMMSFNAPKSLQGAMDPSVEEFLKSVIVKDLGLKAEGEMLGPITFDVSIDGHGPLETEEQNRNVSFDFQSSFRALLKQDTRAFSLPSDILLSLQEYEK